MADTNCAAVFLSWTTVKTSSSPRQGPHGGQERCCSVPLLNQSAKKKSWVCDPECLVDQTIVTNATFHYQITLFLYAVHTHGWSIWKWCYSWWFYKKKTNKNLLVGANCISFTYQELIELSFVAFLPASSYKLDLVRFLKKKISHYLPFCKNSQLHFLFNQYLHWDFDIA